MTTTTAEGEGQLLDRVLDRLSFCDSEESLQAALDVLLVPTVRLLGSSHASTQPKVLKVLSHVNSRCRDAITVRLPISALVSLYLDKDISKLSQSFALVYLRMGWNRIISSEDMKLRAVHACTLLKNLSEVPVKQQAVLFACFIDCVSDVLKLIPNDVDAVKDLHKSKDDLFGFLVSPICVTHFLRLCFDFISCGRKRSAGGMVSLQSWDNLMLEPTSAERSMQEWIKWWDGAVANPSASSTSEPDPAPRLDVSSFIDKKISLLNFLANHNFFSKTSISLCLCSAASEPHHSVQSLGESLFSRLGEVNADDEQLMDESIELLNSLMPVEQPLPSRILYEKRRPVSQNFIISLMGSHVLGKSVKIHSKKFPAYLNIILRCLNFGSVESGSPNVGVNSALLPPSFRMDPFSAKVRRQALTSLIAFLRNVSSDLLEKYDRQLLQKFRNFVVSDGREWEGVTDQPTALASHKRTLNAAEFLQGKSTIYQCIGILCSRSGSLVLSEINNGSPDGTGNVLFLLLSSLGDKSSVSEGMIRALHEVRLSLQKSLPLSDDLSNALSKILTAAYNLDIPEAQVQVLKFSDSLFPFESIPARLLTLRGLGSPNSAVCAEAEAGLSLLGAPLSSGSGPLQFSSNGSFASEDRSPSLVKCTALKLDLLVGSTLSREGKFTLSEATIRGSFPLKDSVLKFFVRLLKLSVGNDLSGVDEEVILRILLFLKEILSSSGPNKEISSEACLLVLDILEKIHGHENKLAGENKDVNEVLKGLACSCLDSLLALSSLRNISDNYVRLASALLYQLGLTYEILFDNYVARFLAAASSISSIPLSASVLVYFLIACYGRNKIEPKNVSLLKAQEMVLSALRRQDFLKSLFSCFIIPDGDVVAAVKLPVVTVQQNVIIGKIIGNFAWAGVFSFASDMVTVVSPESQLPVQVKITEEFSAESVSEKLSVLLDHVMAIIDYRPPKSINEGVSLKKETKTERDREIEKANVEGALRESGIIPGEADMMWKTVAEVLARSMTHFVIGAARCYVDPVSLAHWRRKIIAIILSYRTYSKVKDQTETRETSNAVNVSAIDSTVQTKKLHEGVQIVFGQLLCVVCGLSSIQSLEPLFFSKYDKEISSSVGTVSSIVSSISTLEEDSITKYVVDDILQLLTPAANLNEIERKSELIWLAEIMSCSTSPFASVPAKNVLKNRVLQIQQIIIDMLVEPSDALGRILKEVTRDHTLAESTVPAFLKKLVPRLFRGLYDPNPQVAKSMRTILEQLPGGENRITTEQFELIFNDLIASLTSQNWKARESSCIAIADVIKTRDWKQLRDDFGRLWKTLLMVVDDVKESVREAALKTVRVMSNLTISFLSLSQSNKKNAVASISEADRNASLLIPGEVADVCLPIFMENLSSSVPEVKKIVFNLLPKMCKAAGPKVLSPHVQLLVGNLLEAFSALEPSQFHAAEQHLDTIGISKSTLEAARISIARGTPVQTCLDIALEAVNAQNCEGVCLEILKILKLGVGSMTVVAACTFLQALCTGSYQLTGEGSRGSANGDRSASVGDMPNDSQEKLSFDRKVVIGPVSGKLLSVLLQTLQSSSPAVSDAGSKALAALLSLSGDKAKKNVFERLFALLLGDETKSLLKCNIFLTFALIARNHPQIVKDNLEICVGYFFVALHSPQLDEKEKEKDRERARELEKEKEYALALWTELGLQIETLYLFLNSVIAVIEKYCTSKVWTLRKQGYFALKELCKRLSGYHGFLSVPAEDSRTYDSLNKILDLIDAGLKSKWTGRESCLSCAGPAISFCTSLPPFSGPSANDVVSGAVEGSLGSVSSVISSVTSFGSPQSVSSKLLPLFRTVLSEAGMLKNLDQSREALKSLSVCSKKVCSLYPSVVGEVWNGLRQVIQPQISSDSTESSLSQGEADAQYKARLPHINMARQLAFEVLTQCMLGVGAATGGESGQLLHSVSVAVTLLLADASPSLEICGPWNVQLAALQLLATVLDKYLTSCRDAGQSADETLLQSVVDMLLLRFRETKYVEVQLQALACFRIVVRHVSAPNTATDVAEKLNLPTFRNRFLTARPDLAPGVVGEVATVFSVPSGEASAMDVVDSVRKP